MGDEYAPDEPIAAKCPNCGGDAYIPEAVDALRLVQALTPEERAELGDIVARTTADTFAAVVRSQLPDTAARLSGTLRHPMAAVFIGWAVRRSAR
jgi:hypothetical protein